MRPILLNGHGRPLSLVKYNRDGDLLFTTSKEKSAAVWWADTGNRLGTYDGHNGAIWDLDVTYDSSVVVTGSGDSSAIVWNCRTGEILATLVHRGPVFCVSLAEGDRQLLTLSKALSNGKFELRLYDLDEDLRALNPVATEEGTIEPVQVVPVPEATAAVWLPLNRGVMIGTASGDLVVFPFENGRMVDAQDSQHVIRAHEGKINRIEFNQEKTLFITASKDCTAKLFDTRELVCRKQYLTPTPINHAAISPIFEHVMLGGGQDAKDVTTTSTNQGKFMVRFFHTIYATEFGRVKGHFGPVNTVAFHPSGRGFASGGEDGYVRIHTFDAGYFKVSADEDRDIDKAVNMLS